MTLDDVRKYFEQNKNDEAVKIYLQELSNVSADKKAEIISEYQESEDFRKAVQSRSDFIVEKKEKSLKERFEKEDFPKRLEEEIKKRYPEETPKDRRLRELEDKQAKLERDLAEKERSEFLFQSLSRKKLDSKIIEFNKRLSSAKNSEEFDEAFDFYTKEIHEPSVNDAVKQKLPSLGTVPKNANETPVVKKITGEEYRKLSPEERAKARHENRIEGMDLSRN